MSAIVSLPIATPELLERAAATLPAAWRDLPIFLTFHIYLKENGRIGKEPLIVGTNCHASSTNPQTWRALDLALADCRRRGLFLGLALPNGNTLIDEDEVIGPDGAIAPATLDRIRRLDSLTVRTVSEIGMHTYVLGYPPENATKPKDVELYPGKRLVLWTGDIIEGFDTLHDRTEILAELFPAPAPRPITPLPESSLDNHKIIERTLRMRKGQQLHGAGDVGDYPSRSEAIFGLLNCYIRAGATDQSQLEELFPQSALYQICQDRWDDARWRELTITNALDGTVQPFEGWDQPALTSAQSRATRQTTVPLAADSQSLRFAPGPCADRVAQLEAENAALRQALAERDQLVAHQATRIDTLKTVQVARNRILGNRSHGPSRVVAAVVASEIAWRATAGDTPPQEKDWQVPRGTMAISLGRIANLAGVSVNTASSHLQTLEDRGLIRKETKTVQVRAGDVKDPETGELYTEDAYLTQLFIGPAKITPINAQAAIDLSNDLADFSIQRTENRGGKRTPRCPDHPDAPVIREYVDRCGIPSCKRVLNTDEFELPAMLLRPPEDASAAPETESQTLGGTNPSVVDRHYRPQSLGFGQDPTPDPTPQRQPSGFTFVAGSPAPVTGLRTPPGHCLDCGEKIPVGTFYCVKHGGTAPLDHLTDVAYGARA
jgi:hypothetical protein